MAAAAPPPAHAPGSELLDRLLATLLAADQIAAQAVVRDALRQDWTADDVRFDLITPAMHVIGERWERGEIGVAGEHLATSVCDWLLATLAGRTRRPPPSGRRALVGCSEGELHVLGARIAASVLAERGWTVLFLGAATPADAWPPIVRTRRPEIAVLATTMPHRLERMTATLRAIKAVRPECRTVVGGQAYEGPGGAAGAVGADVVAPDPRELVARLA